MSYKTPLCDIAVGTVTFTHGMVSLATTAGNVTWGGITNSKGVTITASAGGGTPTGFGVSTGGNTAGNTGTKQGSLVLVGSNIISLSQLTDANGATITIDATAAGGAISVVSKFGVSTGGNTTGDTATTYGQVVLAGINAITLSQATAAGSLATITVAGPAAATTITKITTADSPGTRSSRFALEDHAHAAVNSFGVSTIGNTAGNTGAIPGKAVLAAVGGTLSVSTDAGGQTISVLFPSVSTPDRSVHELINGDLITAVISLTGLSMSKRPIFFPFWLDGSISPKTIEYWASRAGGTSLNMTHGIAFYTRVNSTSLALHSSATEGVSCTTSAQYSGARIYGFTGLSNMTLTEGGWVGAYYISGSNNSTDAANLVMYGGQSITSIAGYVFGGTNSTGATNTQSQVLPFWGVYSATTAAFPANVNRTQIAGHGTNAVNADPYIVLREI